jgi:hypothetical protein
MVRPALEPRSSWEGVARDLAARLAPTATVPVAVHPFAPWEGATTLGAVDGGSALVLEGSGLAVGAVRAAGLAWRAHAPLREAAAPLEVRLLDDALAAELADALPGLPPPDGPGHLLERWRALREAERAAELAATLGEGDVLALDGPLAQRDWPASRVAELVALCRRRGALLVGFCKSASGTLAGQPLLPAVARAAGGTAEPWWAEVPARHPATRACAVRFLRRGRVFLAEVPAGAQPEDALARLAPWTRDAGYPGYPYPLALAHNRCALDEALVEDLAHALRGLAARHGVDARAWEEAFGDFHEVLDRGV